MDFQILNFLDKYIFFNNLIQAINILIFLQNYIIVKKKTKINKKKF